MAESEDLRELKNLFKKDRMPDDAIEWLTKKPAERGKGMECVADWFGYFNIGNYEDQTKELLDSTDTFRDNPLLLSRARAAWRLAE